MRGGGEGTITFYAFVQTRPGQAAGAGGWPGLAPAEAGRDREQHPLSVSSQPPARRHALPQTEISQRQQRHGTVRWVVAFIRSKVSKVTVRTWSAWPAWRRSISRVWRWVTPAVTNTCWASSRPCTTSSSSTPGSPPHPQVSVDTEPGCVYDP